jgi:hypothetical protein
MKEGPDPEWDNTKDGIHNKYGTIFYFLHCHFLVLFGFSNMSLMARGAIPGHKFLFSYGYRRSTGSETNVTEKTAKIEKILMSTKITKYENKNSKLSFTHINTNQSANEHI